MIFSRRGSAQSFKTVSNPYGRNASIIAAFRDAVRFSALETDWLAGHIGLELPNPCANYLFEVP
jgi:hypothetical protein